MYIGISVIQALVIDNFDNFLRCTSFCNLIVTNAYNTINLGHLLHHLQHQFTFMKREQNWIIVAALGRQRR